MLAGVSAEIFSTTVMVVLTGSGFGGSAVGCWSCAARHAQNVRRQNARAHPAGFGETARRGREYDLVGRVIERRLRRISRLQRNQRQIFEDSINVAVLRLPEFEAVGAEVNGRPLAGEAPR